MRFNSDDNRTEWVCWKESQHWGFSFPTLPLLHLFPLFHVQVQLCGHNNAVPLGGGSGFSCTGFSCICSVLFSSLLQDIENTLEQAKHMNIYCHFAKGLGEPGYRPVPTWEELNQILVEALDNYNEVNAAMNLVLFEDAMCHV